MFARSSDPKGSLDRLANEKVNLVTRSCTMTQFGRSQQTTNRKKPTNFGKKS